MRTGMDIENPSTPRPAWTEDFSTPPGLEDFVQSPSPPRCHPRNPLQLSRLLQQTPPGKGRIDSSESPAPYTPERSAPGIQDLPTPMKVARDGPSSPRRCGEQSPRKMEDSMNFKGGKEGRHSYKGTWKRCKECKGAGKAGKSGKETGKEKGEKGKSTKNFGSGKGRKGRLTLVELLPEPADEHKHALMHQSFVYLQSIQQIQDLTSSYPSALPGPRTTPNTQSSALELLEPKFKETDAGWEMEIKVRKATKSTDVGMQVTHYHGQPPLKVKKVHASGVIPSWNKLCLGDFEKRAVLEGDLIVSVNETYQVKHMLEEMKSKDLLTFKIIRPSDRRTF